MEIWNEIQPYLTEIVSSLGVIAAIVLTKAKKTTAQKLQLKLDKAVTKTQKAERKLKNAYEHEVKMQKELKNVTSK